VQAAPLARLPRARYKPGMRFSRSYIPTLKEPPAEAQGVSHGLLIRGGYMRKLAAGIYSFLPLGWRVLAKIENIIREEMNRAGALELLMPAAVPADPAARRRSLR